MNQQNEPLRIAILGLGSYGTLVADAMRDCQRAVLTGVISRDGDKRKEWQEKYGLKPENCYDEDDFESIKDNREINCIYIITPNTLHHRHVLRAATTGKHIICEKPLTTSVSEAREMIDACKKVGVRLLVGYRLHFEPHTLEVVKMLKKGAFGKIQYFSGLSGYMVKDTQKSRLDKDLSGGGSLLDIGIYSINGARYMTGLEPEWVTAQKTKTDPEKFEAGVDETIQFQMGFPGGAIASCLSTYNMQHLDRFFLNGEKGFAYMYPATGYGPIRGHTHEGDIEAPDINQQVIQLDAMAGIIFDGEEPLIPVDGEEAIKDIRIIEAIYEAANTGNRISLNPG